MANEQNLKPWQPGESGNPTGKPKGTKHLSTHIRELLESNIEIYRDITSSKTLGVTSTPVEAIIKVLIVKAINGDLRAFDLLAKYGYGTKVDITSMNKEMPIPILSGITNLSDEELDVNDWLVAQNVS